MKGKGIEHRSLRTKENHHLKLPSLPESAAQYRAWRSSIRATVLAFCSASAPDVVLAPDAVLMLQVVSESLRVEILGAYQKMAEGCGRLHVPLHERCQPQCCEGDGPGANPRLDGRGAEEGQEA